MIVVALVMMTLSLHAQQVMAGTNEIFGCPGDCNYDGQVQLGEMIRSLRRALGDNTASLGCPPAERQCDNEVSIDDLVDTVRAGRNGCAGYATTPAALALGVYDVHSVASAAEEESVFDSVGAVDTRFAPFELRLRLTPLQSAYAFGAFAASGAICVEGTYFSGDVVSPLRGQLRYEADQSSLSGTLAVTAGSIHAGLELDLVAERDSRAPAEHAGTYELQVQYAPVDGTPRVTHFELPVSEVDALGFGTCGPVIETTLDGEPLAEIVSGPCWISPRGRIEYFSTFYLPVDPQGCVAPLRFLGSIAAESGASGEFFMGNVPPSCSETATWSVIGQGS